MTDRGMESAATPQDSAGPARPPAIATLWNFRDPAASEARFREWLGKIDGESVEAAELATQVARALGLQGKFDEGFQALADARARAGATAAIVRVRLLLEEGRLHNSSGNKVEALPLFQRAYALAKESGLGALSIDAGHMVAIALSEPVEQIAWNTALFDDAERSTDSDVRKWRASLANNLAWSLYDRESFAEALQWHERALALFEEKGDAEAVRIARWSVAKVKRRLGRVKEALIEQQALLELLRTSERTDGFVQEEIGECLLALGRGDEAVPHFRQAFEQLSAIDWMRRDEAPRLARLAALAGEQGAPGTAP